MNNYLEGLNPAQHEAVVNTKGSALVIAGAGSGKTRVLTLRITHLIESGVPPYKILSLTFTNKAAKEMRERIASLIGSEKARYLWMGTFHSLFAKMLRQDAQAIGYKSNFSIYDSDDSKSLIKTIIKERHLDPKSYSPGNVLARISKAKNNLVTAQAYATNSILTQQDASSRMPEIKTLYKIYSQRCKTANAMDFDDILLNINILLRDHPQVLEKYQNKFNYILVDEYQDTNFAQYLILKKLAERHKNICVVGDDAQSIYAFRGAKIENILNFKNDYPDYVLHKLEQNYRSTKIIVNAANSVIEKNKNRIKKKVFSDNASGNKIKVLGAATDIEEAFKVVNEIKDNIYLYKHQYTDFAILYRTNAQSRSFEEALRKNNIPYRIYGGLSFYQRKEIKDIIAYLRVTVNSGDNEAVKRIINYPVRGIGKTTLEKLEKVAEQLQLPLMEVIAQSNNMEMGFNTGTIKKLQNFKGIIDEFSSKVESLDAFDFAKMVASETGILKSLHDHTNPENLSRYENIVELLNGIKDFCEQTKEENPEITTPNINLFIENVSLLTDADNENDEDRNKVTLMTIHSSKGLEFKNVFIVGVEEDIFPSFRAKESLQDVEEERRLFYVAITRAEDNAYISYARNRYKWGESVSCTPSRFIDEVNPLFLDRTDMDTGSFGSSSNSGSGKAGFKSKSFSSVKPQLEKIPKPDFDPVDSKNFKPADTSKIAVGMTVEHARFGIGKIINIEGNTLQNKKATVFFKDNGQKQLLLKFAKLKVLQ